MHELPITESILDIALRHAENANADRITKIHLVIGQLASIVDDSVQFYWDIVSSGTIAEGAQLIFRRIGTRFQCKDCGLVFSPTDIDYSCPDCGSFKVTVITGKEFFVEAIDIDKSLSLSKSTKKIYE
jgi:hydrogenase nickel incorporation protein HypA/HybF